MDGDEAISSNLSRICICESERKDEEIEEDEETLGALLEASKTPQGRRRLASAGILTATLRRLPSPPSLILPRLRLLRNLCAGEITNQDSFIAAGGPDRVAAVIMGSQLAPPESLRVGLQLLGNVALAGEQHRAAVWARLFPAGFLDLAGVRESGVCDPLCMVLDTCCSSEGGHRRLEDLCDAGRGLPILLEIISTASTVGYREEWFEWLLSKTCIEQPYLSLLFPRLVWSGVSDSLECSRFTKEQAFLLCILSKCLCERPGEVMISNDFALTVVEVLKEASRVVDFFSRGNSALPTDFPGIDVLGYSLTILRDTCAWEGPSAPVDCLLSAGLVQLLLSFLRELEPPSIVKKSIVHASGQAGQPTTADRPLKVCPYLGFRRDVVSVISNCMYRRKQVQDEIREQNGILILLQQCVVDEENPFLREWGLFAVRNLLEGNVENQSEVAELELREPLNTPEISGLGLRVEMDSKDRRAKLVNL